MSEAEMEKLGFAIAAKEAIDKKKEELQKEMNEKVDLGDDNLADMDLSSVPDRKFTEMGKKQIEEEKKTEMSLGDTTMIQMEVLEEKQVEIERLQDMLEKETENLVESRKALADLKEAFKIAEERTNSAIQDKEKF